MSDQIPNQPNSSQPAGQPPYGQPPYGYGAQSQQPYQQQPCNQQPPYDQQQPHQQQPYGGTPQGGVPCGAPSQPYGTGPAPQPPYGSGAPVPPAKQPGDGLALGSLVCGIIALALFMVPVVPVVLAIVSLVLAAKAKKKGTARGGALAGKVCAIIGMVLSVLFTALICLIIWVFSTSWSAYSDSCGYGMHSGMMMDDYGQGDAFDYSAVPSERSVEEQAAEEALSAEFNQLVVGGEAALQLVAARAADSFEDMMGFTMAEAGIDPRDYAAWALEGFAYTSDGAPLVYDGAGERNAYAFVTMRDTFSFSMDFMDEVSQLGFSDLTVEEYRQQVGEAFARCLSTSNATTSDYAVVQVNQGPDGTWTVDPESLEDEIDRLFGLL